MTPREFGGVVVLLLVGVAASYAAAPGLAVLVLVAGAFGLAVADHRIRERRSARVQLRERLMRAARRAEGIE